MEKENFIKLENGTEDSDNILLITENRINYTNLIQVHNNYIASINNNLNLLQEHFEIN